MNRRTLLAAGFAAPVSSLPIPIMETFSAYSKHFILAAARFWLKPSPFKREFITWECKIAKPPQMSALVSRGYFRFAEKFISNGKIMYSWVSTPKFYKDFIAE